jgi:hypothetical protein
MNRLDNVPKFSSDIKKGDRVLVLHQFCSHHLILHEVLEVDKDGCVVRSCEDRPITTRKPHRDLITVENARKLADWIHSNTLQILDKIQEGEDYD